MIPKLKICDKCQKESIIWKSSNTGGLKLCKQCWNIYSINKTQNPTKFSISPVSTKRKKANVEYNKLRLKFLEQNPLCQIKFEKCTYYAGEVHHIRGGEERSVYYLIQSTWAATCRNCHSEIHLESKKARELGWLK